MFSWRLFLDQADALVKTATEAGYRSAVSRAYYAAYHAAVDYAASNGLEIEPRRHVCESDHTACWRTFEERDGQPDLEEVGSRGNTLRSARNDADYRSYVPIDEATAQEVIARARQLIETLDAAA